MSFILFLPLFLSFHEKDETRYESMNVLGSFEKFLSYEERRKKGVVSHIAWVWELRSAYIKHAISKWYEAFWDKPNNKTVLAWRKTDNIISFRIGYYIWYQNYSPTWDGATCTSPWGSPTRMMIHRRGWLWRPTLPRCERWYVYMKDALIKVWGLLGVIKLNNKTMWASSKVDNIISFRRSVTKGHVCRCMKWLEPHQGI